MSGFSDSAPPPNPNVPSPVVIREFNDRGTLWLLEDPELLRGLIQILEPELAARLDFRRAVRVNRSFVPADLQNRAGDADAIRDRHWLGMARLASRKSATRGTGAYLNGSDPRSGRAVG